MGAFINIVCELKITSGLKKNCVKISWCSDVALESYWRKTVLRGHEIHIKSEKLAKFVHGKYSLQFIDGTLLLR